MSTALKARRTRVLDAADSVERGFSTEWPGGGCLEAVASIMGDRSSPQLLPRRQQGPRMDRALAQAGVRHLIQMWKTT